MKKRNITPRISRIRKILALILSSCGLAVGAVAFTMGSAASDAVPLVGQLFTVNSLGDGDDANLSDGRCETATAGECTLRAAIEQINHDNNSADSIGFNIPTAQPWTIYVGGTLPDLNLGHANYRPGQRHVNDRRARSGPCFQCHDGRNG